MSRLLALMETDAGSFEINLFQADAPSTVANFVKLTTHSFYNGLSFHRVIPSFIVQSGCPNSRKGASGVPGCGGPGYTINCEINSQTHKMGTIAMCHAGVNTGGSQFYICLEDQPHLDGVDTVFGHVGNMDVVNALKEGSRINKVSILSLPVVQLNSKPVLTIEANELDFLLMQAQKSVNLIQNLPKQNSHGY